MYYLNDKHSRYEYILYVRHGKAQPYLSGKIYTSYYEIKKDLEETAKRNDRYGRIYYIDEEFFDNEYEKGKGTYYKILCREVNDWKEVA